MDRLPSQGGSEAQESGPWSALLGLIRPRRLEDAPDGELVSRALRGELAAYDVLVGRYEAVVYSHCRRLLGQREDGEDVAQEVFVRAWEALGQCRRPDRPLPWLLSIAHHQAMNFLRRRRRHPKPEEVAMMGGWDGETGNDWDGAAQAGEVDPGQITVEELERAVEELSSEDGALFELRYRGELSIREVAEVLQRRENAVKVGLHRLRGRIQQAVIRRRGGQS